MSIKIRLAVRDWDFLNPLLRGAVASDRVDLEIHHVNTVPKNFAAEHSHDAGEISFSRYVSARGRGETDVVGVPNFVLRSFRHRCIITTKSSKIVRLEDLAGKKIGLSGWQDTGSIWTRAALAHAGVGIDDAFWFLGRLTRAEKQGGDVLEGFGRPGRIEASTDERSLLELLVAGELDAVFCPVLPEGFYNSSSEFRHLLPDFRDQELVYSRAVGYVPGVHTFGIKAPLVAAHPWLPQVLSDLIDASRRMWLEQRRINVETTPWMMDELLRVARDLPASWSDSGFAANEKMIADFGKELHMQGIAPTLLSPADIFPAYAHVSGSKEERRRA